jgi:hypothetical protein
MAFDTTFDALDTLQILRVVRARGDRASRARPTYRHEYWCGRVFVQHGTPSTTNKKFRLRRNSRVEFHPASIRGPSRDARRARNTVQLLLRLAKPGSLRVSRLDVAVDIPISLRRLQVLGSPRQKANVFLGPQGIETIYLGRRKSDRQLRIYDRRRLLVEKGLAGDTHPDSTRVEAQLRNLGSIRNLSALPNPFSDLQLFHLTADGLTFPRRVLVEYAGVFGLRSLKARLTRDEFRDIAGGLELVERSGKVPHPRDAFATQWPEVARSLRQLLNGPGR